MTSGSWRFRLAALLAAGALAVHELRYALAYGPDADHASGQQGHAYLSVLVPLVVLAALFAAAHALARVARGQNGGERTRRLARLWLVCAATLAVAYCGQELLEGWLTSGHPAGVAGVLGHGGWIGLTVAPLVGGLIALALRGAAAASEPAATAGGWRTGGLPAPVVASAAPVFALARDPIARFLAGRGPPLTSV